MTASEKSKAQTRLAKRKADSEKARANNDANLNKQFKAAQKAIHDKLKAANAKENKTIDWETNLNKKRAP